MDAKDKAPGIYPLSVRKGSSGCPTACPSPSTRCRNAWNRNRTTRRPPPSRSRCRSSSTGASIGRATGTCSASKAAPASEIVAEVYARRLDSPLDSVLKLTDAAGKQLAFNDDHEDKGCGLEHAPRRFLAVGHPARRRNLLPATWATRSTRAARSMPTACASARRGPISSCGSCRRASTSRRRRACRSPSMPCARTASPARSRWRLKDAPAGFTLSGGRVPAGQDQVRLTLTVPATSLDGAAQPVAGRPGDDRGPRGRPRRPCRPKT